MKKIVLLIVLLATPVLSFAQEESWQNYIAAYEKNIPGSTVVRMDLKEKAPLRNYQYVLVTGYSYETVRTDGLPDNDAFRFIHSFDDELFGFIESTFKVIHAGTFTHDTQRLHYFYIQSAENVDPVITEFYADIKPNVSKPYVNVTKDIDWEYYLNFLYPSDEILNYMGDMDVVQALKDSGDVLYKPRLVEHWIYFGNSDDRKRFRKSVEEMGFKIEDSSTNQDSELKYQLRISREDKVDLDTINGITNELRVLAIEHNGDYDGWETFVVKD